MTDIEKLEKKIFDVICEENVEDMLSALCGVIVFAMSLTCPDCRENIAEKIKHDVPLWLAHANALATEYPDQDYSHTH